MVFPLVYGGVGGGWNIRAHHAVKVTFYCNFCCFRNANATPLESQKVDLLGGSAASLKCVEFLAG